MSAGMRQFTGPASRASPDRISRRFARASRSGNCTPADRRCEFLAPVCPAFVIFRRGMPIRFLHRACVRFRDSRTATPDSDAGIAACLPVFFFQCGQWRLTCVALIDDRGDAARAAFKADTLRFAGVGGAQVQIGVGDNTQ